MSEKRLWDIAAAATGIILVSPAMGLTALGIWWFDGGPVFYGGERVGLHGKGFRMWKFRTMVVDADQIGGSSTSDDDSRLTPIGRFLRRYKLDELPQLWNVLVGDMSLVGPRPQVAWAVERYTEEERILLTVRPGITDPASLRFANEGQILRGHPDPDKAYYELIHPEKMRLSIDYVKHRSFLGDVRILFATLAAPLRRSAAPPAVPDEDTST